MIVLLLTITFGTIEAQNTSFPVTVNTIVNPPFSVNFEDYTNSAVNQLMAQVTLNEVGRVGYRARLRVTIQSFDGSVRFTTRTGFLPSRPLVLDGGIPETLFGVDMAEYFNPNNMQFQGISRQEFIRNGSRLPDGAYMICVEVLDFNRGTVVSGAGCSAPFFVILNDPPFLNLPFPQEKLIPQNPQNLIFSWTPRHLGSPNSAFTTEFIFQLFEIRPSGRNPNDAVLTTMPIFETVTTLSQLNYGPIEPLLIPGMEYAWRVQATDIDGRDLFKNNGYSEVSMFIYGDACIPPTNISAEGSSGRSIKVEWLSDFAHRSYNTRYRKVTSGRAQTWRTRNSLLEETSIYELSPNTTYEYQVQAECIVDQSDFSAIAQVTTQDVPVVAELNCGVEDVGLPIDNQDPLPNLYELDTIHTGGGFKVIVTEVAGGNGTFSGKGMMMVPMFSGSHVAMEFASVRVNTEYRQTGG